VLKAATLSCTATEGGMDIEEVAHSTPELIHKEEIDPKVGLQGFQARKIAFNLGLIGDAFKDMVKFITALYKAYDATDSSQFEINPVLKTSDNKILAVDAKVNLTITLYTATRIMQQCAILTRKTLPKLKQAKATLTM
jgi:succinyl-CoA synthetase beta subunit